MAVMPHNPQICPQCGTVCSGSAEQCPDCGQRLREGSVRRDRRERAAGLPFAEHLGAALKLVVVLAIVGAFFGGLYYGVTTIFRQAEDANPYPRDPRETAELFFARLAAGSEEEYQAAYSLLDSQRKAATAIGRQSRAEGYFPHFERIRQYLVRRSGEGFLSGMSISENGRTVSFPGGVALTLRFTVMRGTNEQNHYALNEINEFPIDVAPGIGLEAHNRRLSRAVEGLSALGGDSDDAAEILAAQPYENPAERLERLIESFRAARQLDTRHTVLEAIIREFPDRPTAQRCLREVVEDDSQPPHLRRLAQQALDYYRGR